MSKLILIVAMLFGTTAFGQGILYPVEVGGSSTTFITPTLGGGGDTYIKGKGYVGLSLWSIGLGSGSFGAPTVAAFGVLQGRYEAGAQGEGYSIVAGGAMMSRSLIIPPLFVKRSFYTEYDTRNKGDVIALGTVANLNVSVWFWAGYQRGILDGEKRDGLYLSAEVGI